LLVPPKDPVSLAHAIDRLLDDVDLGAALGAAARRAVLSRHTPEHRAATLSGLYSALTGMNAEPCRTG
jgi:glycosyltransferase involved in cell wall biosynthesis